MKKSLFIATFIFLVIFSACNTDRNNNKENSTKDDVKQTFTKLSIPNFDYEAEKHVGDTIQIEGTVGHICSHGGKKMHVFEAPIDTISVKVVANETFDADLEGSDVVVTGILNEKRITADEINEMDEQYKIECDGSIVKGAGNEESGISKEYLDYLKELLAESGKGYISFYSINFIELLEK